MSTLLQRKIRQQNKNTILSLLKSMFLIGFILGSGALKDNSIKLLVTLQLCKIYTSALVHTPLNEAAEDKNWYVQALR